MSPLLVSHLALWAVVVVLCVVVFALVRQIGVLHERIAPVGALMLAKGLKVGELAPTLPVADLTGRAIAIGGERAEARTQLVMFVSPTCPVCKALLPVLKSARRSEQGWLDIVMASDGDFAEHSNFVREQSLEGFPYVLSAPLGVTYQVNRLPYAVLIDPQGVLRARGIINSREHLESLFEAKRLGVASIQDYLDARGGG
jgi:methylamine dehydrogenase accessory protein MauD